MRRYQLILIGCFSWLGLSSCQQSSGTGASVTIPQLSVSCTASNCTGSSSPRIFVYITTSGCLNIAYGQVASGTGRATCSGGACSSTPTITWVDVSNASITQIPSNTYDFCAIIDLTDTYAGVAVPSGDATSSKSVSVGTSTSPVSSISLSSWINGTFLN